MLGGMQSLINLGRSYVLQSPEKAEDNLISSLHLFIQRTGFTQFGQAAGVCVHTRPLGQGPSECQREGHWLT